MDSTLEDLLQQELVRQQNTLSFIASENYASQAVIQAQASVATNKYAEGYPGKRYYAGCEVVDRIENLAIERAKELFGVAHANVQPHAGAMANLAVFQTLLSPNDTFLGLSLADGGHLSHGSKVNISGINYQAVTYGVDSKTERLDYSAIQQLALTHRPRLIIAGYSAYPAQIDWQAFRQIADSVGAYLLADIAHTAGFIAAGLLPSPQPYADVITSTTHKSLRGPRGGLMMACRDAALGKKLDKAIFPGVQGGPMMHTIAAKAQAFYEALQPDFVDYQRRVLENAQTVADRFQYHGYALASGGTQTHLVLVKLVDITGHAAEQRLAAAHLLVNKNTIPGDTRSPFVTSGIRIGTPAVTTRGLTKEAVCAMIDGMVALLEQPDDPMVLERVRQEVIACSMTYPVYSQGRSW